MTANKLHISQQCEGETYLSFHCPACERDHRLHQVVVRTNGTGWKWNGSLDRPTFEPSVLVNVGGMNPTAPICHSFVRDGMIEFLSDCTHAMAGQTVEIPAWDSHSEDKENGVQNVRVRFNKEFFSLALGCHNGRELRELFAVKADHDLYLCNRDDFGDDTFISDEDHVDVFSGDKFYSVSQKINGGG